GPENVDELLPLGTARVEPASPLRCQTVDAPPSAAPAVRLGLPDRFDFAGRFKPVEGRIKGSLFEPQQAAPGQIPAVYDFRAPRPARAWREPLSPDARAVCPRQSLSCDYIRQARNKGQPNSSPGAGLARARPRCDRGAR